jgi:hypothetical protein
MPRHFRRPAPAASVARPSRRLHRSWSPMNRHRRSTRARGTAEPAEWPARRGLSIAPDLARSRVTWQRVHVMRREFVDPAPRWTYSTGPNHPYPGPDRLIPATSRGRRHRNPLNHRGDTPQNDVYEHAALRPHRRDRTHHRWCRRDRARLPVISAPPAAITSLTSASELANAVRSLTPTARTVGWVGDVPRVRRDTLVGRARSRSASSISGQRRRHRQPCPPRGG